MAVIMAFKEKQQEKQISFERKVLRDLSLKSIRETVGQFFSPFFNNHMIFTTAIEDGSIDIAIESYLLGASMSRFGYFGESPLTVRGRCKSEEKYLVDNLLDYLQYWGAGAGHDFQLEALYLACEHFTYHWWLEGFKKGEMRYKLRLH